MSVVYDSGGLKMDIVVDVEGGFIGECNRVIYGKSGVDDVVIGFYVMILSEFVEGFEKVLSLENLLEVRLWVRESVKRFIEEEFVRRWVREMEFVIGLNELKVMMEKRRV